MAEVSLQMSPEDLSRMSRVLHHRLKNFASGIKSAVTLLSDDLEGKLAPATMEYFPLMIAECRSLEETAERMSLLFDTPPDRETGTVSAVLDEAAARLRSAVPSAEVSVRCAGRTGETALRGVNHLVKALLEVLKNAAEAAHDGKVVVNARTGDSMVAILVSDDGAGLPEEEHEQIFLPFYTTRARHLGLGLSIARRLTAEAGGTVAIRSGRQEGLTVEIAVPAVSGAGT